MMASNLFFLASICTARGISREPGTRTVVIWPFLIPLQTSVSMQFFSRLSVTDFWKSLPTIAMRISLAFFTPLETGPVRSRESGFCFLIYVFARASNGAGRVRALSVADLVIVYLAFY